MATISLISRRAAGRAREGTAFQNGRRQADRSAKHTAVFKRFPRTFFYSIRLRIVAAYMALLVVAFVAVGVMIIQLNADFLIDQRVRQELERADSLAVQAAVPLHNADAETLAALAREAVQASSVRGVLVLDRYGVVQVDAYSYFNGVRMNHIEVCEVLTGAKDRSYGFHRSDAHGGGEWLGYFTSVIVHGARVEGALLISISVQDVVDRIDAIQSTMYVYFAAVVCAVVLLGFVISDVITRPVNELSNVMLKTSVGDFSARASVKGRDEIAHLATTFNSMSERLENLDQMRNEFISSASHELKTPLASIKILIQSLLGGDTFEPGITREFLTDVDKEVDRLASIVGDLLTLVQMDSRGVLLRRAPVDIGALMRDTRGRIEPFAKARGIDMSLDIRQEVTCLLDRQRVQQVIYNLMDNAIKYTPEGGRAGVRLEHDGRDAIITVWDTGIGIDEKALPRIFDRFYRVDKARSRETGGTGLGLSITRDIVNMHGGVIEVHSAEDEGTTFTVRFPLDPPQDGFES